MASERQFEANRKNAKRSTGPKTGAGKARSSRNALRHGLARTTIANEVAPEGLIAALISSVNHSMQLEDAESLVRAKGILSRIRIIRHEALIALLECHTPSSLRTLKSLERYERTALAKQKRVLRSAKKIKEIDG